MNIIRACAFASACLLMPLAAVAQWQWIDGSGKKVYSDTAPPPGVAEKDILRRNGMPVDRRPVVPASTPSSASSDGDAAAAPRAAASARPAPGVDKELEEKIRKAEAAEKAKRTAEEQKLKAARTENCARAREGKATLVSGVRLARLNAQGEREVMDDTARATELQRLDGIIASDCK